MSFRTVVISSRCKLEYSLNYLVCRGEEEKRICVDEISTLIIQNIGVAMTAALLSRLLEAKVKVIICDPKSNPQGELVGYYDNYESFEKIKEQLAWDDVSKADAWELITRAKIEGQACNLVFLKHPSSVFLEQYAKDVLPGDPTNREGHAAKVYFDACFGSDFSRGQNIFINAALNYGYSLILSSLNREVKAFGYLTEFGIHHIGGTNPFNLSCDLMEPLRPLVDFQVLAKKVNETNFKEELVKILSLKVRYQGNVMFLDNALHLYAQGVLLYLKRPKETGFSFIEYELA